MIAYNFDVPLEVKDAYKDGGWQWYGFANQGDRVSSLQANEHAGSRASRTNSGGPASGRAH